MARRDEHGVYMCAEKTKILSRMTGARTVPKDGDNAHGILVRIPDAYSMRDLLATSVDELYITQRVRGTRTLT